MGRASFVGEELLLLLGESFFFCGGELLLLCWGELLLWGKLRLLWAPASGKPSDAGARVGGLTMGKAGPGEGIGEGAWRSVQSDER